MPMTVRMWAEGSVPESLECETGFQEPRLVRALERQWALATDQEWVPTLEPALAEPLVMAPAEPLEPALAQL